MTIQEQLASNSTIVALCPCGSGSSFETCHGQPIQGDDGESGARQESSPSTAELPVVPRYNAWGEWRPLVARCSQAEYFRIRGEADNLRSNNSKAIYYYNSFTPFQGVEFIIVSNGSDDVAYRRYPGGMIAVACQRIRPVLEAHSVRLYDCWLPMTECTPSAIADALDLIDETVSLVSLSLGTAARWIIKYAENVGPSSPLAMVTSDEHEELARRLANLRNLPKSLQRAVVRSIHWRQHARIQARTTDQLLALWQAFESLLLALYEHSGDVELPLAVDPRALSRKQRHEEKCVEIRRILDEQLSADPVAAVSRAYFDAVIGIRKRCEMVLKSILGADDERIEWALAQGKNVWSPQRIRNLILHEGRSATEVEAACDVSEQVGRLDDLVIEIIVRTIGRRWQGVPLRTGKQQFTALATGIPLVSNGWEVRGDFHISIPKLVALGVY